MFRRGNPFVRAREEASSTCGASHLRTGLSLSWPSHVHIQPNLLKSCQSTALEATNHSWEFVAAGLNSAIGPTDATHIKLERVPMH